MNKMLNCISYHDKSKSKWNNPLNTYKEQINFILKNINISTEDRAMETQILPVSTDEQMRYEEF